MRTRSAIEIQAYNNGLETAARIVETYSRQVYAITRIREMKLKPKHPEDRDSGFLDLEMIDEIMRHLGGVLPGSNRETARMILVREFTNANTKK